MSARDNSFSRTPAGRFRVLRYHAKRLGLALDIDFSEYAEMLNQPCFYCGFPLAETGRGVDRMNPKGAYTKDNIVPSCGECNAFKGDLFTHDEMLVIGAAVGQVKAARTIPHIYRRGRH